MGISRILTGKRQNIGLAECGTDCKTIQKERIYHGYYFETL
jgi:hypothetical protein